MSKKGTTDFGSNAVSTDIAQRVRLLAGEDVDAIRSEQAALHADEVALVRGRLASSATGHLSRAADKIVKSPTERLSDADFKAFTGSVTHAARAAVTDRELRRLEKRYRSQVRVTGEVDPYSENSPHSWIRDSLAAGEAQGPGLRVDAGGGERLQRSAALADRAVQKRSRYGRQLLAQQREGFRGADVNLNRQLVEQAEQRALTTGGGVTVAAAGGGAASFATPAFLMDAWAQYRSPYASFIGQCDNSTPLPDFGLTVYIPVVTTGTTVATDTEGSGTAEGDPVTGFASSAVVQKAGQITVSQAMLDRVGPGISGDVFLWTQLKNQLVQQVNLYAIQQAIAGSQAVVNNGSFALTSASGVGGLLGDLKTAKNKTRDQAGTRTVATHAFASGDLCDYIASYADAQGRPVFSPAFDDSRLPIRSVGDEAAEGYTGHVLVNLALFADDSIPTTTTANLTQIIVTRASEILQLEGPPIQYIMPQGAASNLEAVIGVRQYCATVARFPSGVATIGGAAYAAASFL